MWIVYLLACRNTHFYCGITTNLEQRIKQHNGELPGGGKYTRANRPCRLVYQEYAADRSTASQREYEIKAMSHNDKLLLFKSHKIAPLPQ